MAPGPSDKRAPVAAISASALAETIEAFLAENPAAVILEEGRVAFDTRNAHYSISDTHGRCVLQLWSEERNLVRTVVEVQERAHSLRLLTRRMGAPRPQVLELVSSPDRRTPTARESARRIYQRLLERVLSRINPGAKVDGMRSAMDLEHSFGPAYTRGRLLRGTAAEAIVGIGAAEAPAAIDGILTIGILWLDHCRQEGDGRRHFGGLKVIVPAGCWRSTAERMAWLNHAAAGFELWTLDERCEELVQLDFRDIGNIESRLVHAFSAEAAVERCRAGVDRLLGVLEPAIRDRIEVYARSTAEVALLLHGLEFARVRHGAAAHSFTLEDEVTFGAGANETPLTAENETLYRELFMRLFHSRHAAGKHTNGLFRMQPERWLESRLRRHIVEIFPGLLGETVYSQVPALSSGNRGLLDLLIADRDGRLNVLEVKADEDLHLPLQALDYWIRVRALNDDRPPRADGRPLCAFERQGYFPDVEVSPRPPRLLLVAPALRIHPSNQIVLRYLSPEIEWELVALGENWREELQVVFRKRSGH